MTAPSCKLTVNDVLPDLLAYTARPGKATGGDYHLVIGNLNVRTTMSSSASTRRVPRAMTSRSRWARS